MKKLIMLSVFALGTITAGASNDYFKNQYSSETSNIIEMKTEKRHYVRQVNIDANGGLYETIIVDLTICGTATQHSRHGFIIHEMYILNNTSGMPRFYNTQNIGICF